MAATRNQKMILALEMLEFTRQLDALAAKAMYLGIDKTGYVMACVDSWSSMAIKATCAVDMVEQDEKKEQTDAGAVLAQVSKDKN